MKIGVIGNGFVGRATCQLMCKDIEIFVYDINPDLCSPKGTVLIDLMQCSIIFVSVPTPMNKDGSCYLDIVKSVVNEIKQLDYKGNIVLRSTVPAGTCDELGCYFMPEFLTEKNYIEDFISNKYWIFGSSENDDLFKSHITDLINYAKKNKKILYDNIKFMKTKEAEMVKLFRNTYLTTKVSFCNEIAHFCEQKNINYENVRKVATLDDRITESHTYVPGPDGKLGFGGTCFPKDSASLKYEMEKAGVFPIILSAVIDRNETIDRVEKDWLNDKGRSSV